MRAYVGFVRHHSLLSGWRKRLSVCIVLFGLAQIASAAGGPQEQSLTAAGFQQNIGEKLAVGTKFLDDNGLVTTLNDALNGKPAILVFAWYDCPNLCSILLDDLTANLEKLSWQAGKEYSLVVIGIDPGQGVEEAAAVRRRLAKRLKRPASEEGWHFLSGGKQEISLLAEQSGFEYAWDDKSKQYSHPTGLVLVTPEGVIGRYLMGIQFAPDSLRTALAETSGSQLGDVVDALLLRCFSFDPASGQYTLRVLEVTRVAGSGFVLLLLLAFGIYWYRDRRRAV